MLEAHGAQPWVFAGQDWLVRDPHQKDPSDGK
jgi:hypothetical protein